MGRVRALPVVVLVACPVLVLAGCGGKQNTLAPASPQEHKISVLFWIMMAVAWAGFALIVGLLALGWVHRKKEGLPFGRGDKTGTGLVIGLGVAMPIVLLTVLFVYSDLFVLNSTAAPDARTTKRTVEIVGHQWFWEARYPGTDAVTANDIHIPAGVRVNTVVRTVDVIHSFWVPELNRKIDLIPGHRNTILLDASRPGTFRGQCAEFCGLQHANMSLVVYADPPARFRAWLANEAKPGREPSTPDEERGREIFLSHTCSGCHTIRGTSADGHIGPDLTHVGGRQDLAGLVLGNTPANMLRWIHDPQHIKPGVKMPDLHLAQDEERSVVAYLESLK
jgi:cytochrome c oxidase subunit 2